MFQDWSPGSVTLPISSAVLCNFIAFLFANNYSPSSFSSHTCAIVYIHKVPSIADPTESFLVKKVLRGCHQLAPSKDTRIPITDIILVKLMYALDHTVQTFFYIGYY